jgi:hypothetical protein
MGGGICDRESGAPLGRRMTSREKEEIKCWMKMEVELLTRQPAGE